jgi:hypothetical protein
MPMLLAAGLMSQAAQAQISKANQILLNRGLQLQNMVEYDDIFSLNTFSNANYTSVNWLDTDYQPLLGPAPGFFWGRWISDPTDMPPRQQQTSEGFSDETPYMSQLVDLELSDEPNLDDGTVLTNEINWFLSVETNFPNTILYINNYGGQASDATLATMITAGHVDMICFDEYPFTSQYDTNQVNDIGPPNTWPFTSWLSELRRYRQNAMNYGIPFATYMQTFNSVQSYNDTVYRNPSPSELRFNNSAALAFNAKTLIGFTYNSGAAALFNILPNGYSGDTYTNELYQEQADVNHRDAILGRALVCLQPVYDLHNPNDSNPPSGPASAYTTFPDGTTTSILILKGNPATTNDTPEPIGFQDSVAAPKSYSWWEYQKNDPYLNGWTVTNSGTNNGGLAGQVFISWFRLLDQDLGGTNFTNEVYLMVVNGLTSPSGTAADCAQQIKLNFAFGSSGISNVVMPDPESGPLTTNATTSIGSGKRQLVLNLNGGDAVLFKFADGAPFAGHVPPQPPRLALSMASGAPVLNLTQLTPGARYELQASPTLASPNWRLVTGLMLTNSSFTYQDSFVESGCYYRVIGIP